MVLKEEPWRELAVSVHMHMLVEYLCLCLHTVSFAYFLSFAEFYPLAKSNLRKCVLQSLLFQFETSVLPPDFCCVFCLLLFLLHRVPLDLLSSNHGTRSSCCDFDFTRSKDLYAFSFALLHHASVMH